MYQINNTTLKSILNRKFSSFVGVILEEVDHFKKDYNLKEEEVKFFKKLIKKISYESMRDIENQVSAFSDGVNIAVNLEKPTE